MLSAVNDYLWRHKRKIFITTFTIGGAVIAFKYAKHKIIQYQQNQNLEFIERAKRMQHFEATEQTCNQAIIGLARAMCQELLKQVDPETILLQLRQNPENKLELWDELKVLAFTRLTTLVYASSMLVVSIRIKMNILGGYMYKDKQTDDTQITADIQQHYLTLSQYFLKNGLVALSQLIESKVRHILSAYDLKQKMSLGEIEQIFWSIQMAVNSDAKDPCNSMVFYLFPKAIDDGCDILTKLFTETLDVFESDEIAGLCTNNICCGFATIMDSIADSFNIEPMPIRDVYSNGNNLPPITSMKQQLNVENGNIYNINSVRLPLAKLIPIINELGSKEYDQRQVSFSSSLITQYLLSDKMKLLGANVYEVFSQ